MIEKLTLTLLVVVLGLISKDFFTLVSYRSWVDKHFSVVDRIPSFSSVLKLLAGHTYFEVAF